MCIQQGASLPSDRELGNPQFPPINSLFQTQKVVTFNSVVKGTTRPARESSEVPFGISRPPVGGMWPWAPGGGWGVGETWDESIEGARGDQETDWGWGWGAHTGIPKHRLDHTLSLALSSPLTSGFWAAPPPETPLPSLPHPACAQLSQPSLRPSPTRGPLPGMPSTSSFVGRLLLRGALRIPQS